MPEIWKPVRGYTGYYEVSDHGRVRSLDRWINVMRPTGKVRIFRRGVVMTPVRAGYRGSAHGCLQVSLSKNGECESCVVSRLVLNTFGHLAPRFAKTIHYDQDYTNNALNNIDFREIKRRRK